MLLFMKNEAQEFYAGVQHYEFKQSSIVHFGCF